MPTTPDRPADPIALIREVLDAMHDDHVKYPQLRLPEMQLDRLDRALAELARLHAAHQEELTVVRRVLNADLKTASDRVLTLELELQTLKAAHARVQAEREELEKAWHIENDARHDAQESLAALHEAQREICICAAIRLDDGELFRGHRHDDAIQVAGGAGVPRKRIAEAEQGFITSHNRFVSREEGAELQRNAGIPSAHTGRLPEGMLFSEDLYLRSTKGQSLDAVRGRQASGIGRMTDQDENADGSLGSTVQGNTGS